MAKKSQKQNLLQPTPGEKASSEPSEPDGLKRQKFNLEVKELRQKTSPWRFVSVIVPVVTALGLGIGALFSFLSEKERRRLETVTHLKEDLANDNSVIRIGAVHALADYPKEAIPALIASLGRTKPAQGGNHSQIEEDTAFTSAVKDSLRQIGKEAANPLIREVGRIQGEIRGILISDIITSEKLEILPPEVEFADRGAISYNDLDRRLQFRGVMSEDVKAELLKLSTHDSYRKAVEGLFQKSLKVKQLYETLPFNIFDETEAATRKLRKVVAQKGINLDDEEINYVIQSLKNVRSSRYDALTANKNGTETLAYLLRTHGIKRFESYRLDLPGADLSEANLSGADLEGANLSGASLRKANLSSVGWREANLSGANLEGANLSDALLSEADLSGAYLRGANLSGAGLGWANLSGADLGWTDLLGAGLSRANLSGANLEGAKLSGAFLSEANLDRVKGFREVRDFGKADLRGVKGLSGEDLKFAKSKGAIIDEPAIEKEKPKEPAE